MLQRDFIFLQKHIYMKKITWDDLIQSEKESIKLIWYWSILNSHTHEWKTSMHNTVIVKWFQRIYNLKMVPPGFCKVKLEAFMKKYWGKYGITSMEQVEELEKENVCVLNAICTENKNDMLNGLLVTIQREDFETYKKREEIYDLYETPYCIINPKTGDIEECHEHGFILSAHKEYLIENGKAFLPYHQLSRNGAYNFWEYFWKLFDTTTFCIED